VDEQSLERMAQGVTLAAQCKVDHMWLRGEPRERSFTWGISFAGCARGWRGHKQELCYEIWRKQLLFTQFRSLGDSW